MYVAQHGFEPNIILTSLGLGFAMGEQMETAAAALDFILNGRSITAIESVASSNEAKSLYQKIIIITGGAQGFGYGMTKCAAKLGAYIIIAVTLLGNYL